MPLTAGMISGNRTKCAVKIGAAPPQEETVTEPFIGEIKIWSLAWAPQGWALCDGTLLTVQQNQALYALLGTQFGGTPGINYNLPDLRGRTPMGWRDSPEAPTVIYQQGTKVGVEGVTLTAANVPSHVHTVVASVTEGTQIFPFNTNYFGTVVKSVPATPQQFNVYLPPTTPPTSTATLSTGSNGAAAVSTMGGGVAHDNMQPFLVLNFIICTSGLFPSRN
jgi:microcystin-dependent protein